MSKTKLIADVSTITTVFFKALEKVIQVIAHVQGHAHQLKSIYSMLTQCGGCGLFNVLTNEVQHLGSSSPTSLLKSLLDICIWNASFNLSSSSLLAWSMIFVPSHVIG